ncbi:MAG: SPASM domain-containing protein [Proteobacteria bacterium]|nr:SPASM domain-containing protein [Pseudomonadota bacterium]
MDILQTLLNQGEKQKFSAWQIELTTRCSLLCTMCIKEEYKIDHHRDMNIDDFKKILPYLKDVENVVLERWGESLLHKDLIECIRLVKQEGARAGFVTSGMGLTDEYAAKLISAEIDFIGFSLSGATPQTHNAIRVNSDFHTLINSIKFLGKLADKNNFSRKPALHIVYLMLKENIGELPVLIDLAEEMGIQEIILLNIIQISNSFQNQKKVFTCKNEKPYKELLKKVMKRAGQLNIRLTIPNLTPCKTTVCSENPLKNLYISVEGNVSPCVYLYPPVPGKFKKIFCDKECIAEKVSFGNIFREPFESIWNKKEYTDFRDCFTKKQHPPQFCMTCHKILGF